MLKDFTAFMQEALSQDLPGARAHRKMLSPEMPDRILIPRDDARHSAVLVAIHAQNSFPTLIYTKRQEYPGVHSGQISFPGGKMEPSDTDLQHTALRESEEEIGLHPKNVRIIGKLSQLYIERSNHLVQPYVGIVTELNHLVPQQREVKKIIHAPIFELHQAPIHHFILQRNRREFEMPYFDLQGEVLWGATAMMTSEFLEISAPFFKK